MKLVSVILPFYNAQEYIKPALTSILRQHYRELEIILVNDGSTDNSEDIALKLTSNDDRVKYLYLDDGPHGHVAAGRNAGIEVASGDYITFQDADDVSDLKRIQRQVDYMSAFADVEFVSCLARDFSDGGKVSKAEGGAEFLTSKQIARNLYRCNCIIQACTLFRRNVFDKYGYYDVTTPYAKDYEYWLRLLGRGAEFHKIPEILYHRRIHPEQWMALNSSTLVHNSMELKLEKALLPRLKHDNRDLVIWGWGTAGKGFYDVAKRNGLTIKHIVDGVPDNWGTIVDDLTVESPHSILEWGDKYIYILCSHPGRAMAREIMDEAGLRYFEDYFEFA